MTHPHTHPSAHTHAQNTTSTSTPTTHKVKSPLSHIYNRTKAILAKFFTRLRRRSSRRRSSSSSPHYTHQMGTLSGAMGLQDYPTQAEGARGREFIRRLGSGRFWSSPPRPWEEEDEEDERQRFVVEGIREVERDESGGRVYEFFFEYSDPGPKLTEPPVMVRMRAQLGDIKDKVLKRKPPAPVAAMVLRPERDGDPDSSVAVPVVLVRRAVRRAELEGSGVPAELEAPAPAHLRPGRERDHRVRMQMQIQEGKGVPSTNHSPKSGVSRKPLPAQIRPGTANSVRSEQEGSGLRRKPAYSSLRQNHAQNTQPPRAQAPAKEPTLHSRSASGPSPAPVETEAWNHSSVRVGSRRSAETPRTLSAEFAARQAGLRTPLPSSSPSYLSQTGMQGTVGYGGSRGQGPDPYLSPRPASSVYSRSSKASANDLSVQ